MKRSDIEDQVRQTSWPAPPPRLRDRVLSAAVVGAHPITWSDRVWFSRAWRLSVVAAALAVVVLNQVSGSPRSTDIRNAAQAIADAQVIDDATWPLGLPPAVGASLARRELLSAGQPPRAALSVEMWLEEFMQDGGGE